MTTRPDVTDWGIVGQNAALRLINVDDPIDVERYWETDQSVGDDLMVDGIETLDELIANARGNGPHIGFTYAISGVAGDETGELQGFVQFTPGTRGMNCAKRSSRPVCFILRATLRFGKSVMRAIRTRCAASSSPGPAARRRTPRRCR